MCKELEIFSIANSAFNFDVFFQFYEKEGEKK